VFQGAPPSPDHRVREADLDLGEHPAKRTDVEPGIDFLVHVLDAGVGNDGGCVATGRQMLGGLTEELAGGARFQVEGELPGQDAPAEVLDGRSARSPAYTGPVSERPPPNPACGFRSAPGSPSVTANFACTACAARSRAIPCREWVPNTWLPLAACRPYARTAPPSPCARFSRVRTTTEAPPPDRDNAGLGGLPRFATRGARLGVPLFNGETLDALGGQLYPSPHGPTPESGFRCRRTRTGCTQSIRQDNRVLAANTPESVVRSLQRLPSLTSTCAVVRAWLHHGICGRPTSSGPLRPFGSCRPSIRSWTTFAAPFYARPDRARMASHGSIGFSSCFQGALTSMCQYSLGRETRMPS